MKHESLGQVYLDEQSGKKRVKLFQPDLMVDAIQRYDVGDRVILKLETFYRKRSLKQNNVFHKYIAVIADHTGHEPSEIKIMVKNTFLKAPMTDKFGNEVVDSETGEIVQITRDTSSLTTVEMIDLCDKVREWSGRILGIELPIPDSNWKIQFNK